MALQGRDRPFRSRHGDLSRRAAGGRAQRKGHASLPTRCPASVEGVPIRFQAIELNLDRPGLRPQPDLVWPTPPRRRRSNRKAALGRQLGESVSRSRGCGRLGFSPRVQMALRRREPGKGRRRSSVCGSRPVCARATPICRPMTMSLPKALASTSLPSRRSARARTPMRHLSAGLPYRRRHRPVRRCLSEPLRGSIYVVQPKGNGLPDLCGRASSAGGIQVSMQGKTLDRATGTSSQPWPVCPTYRSRPSRCALGSARKGAFLLAADPCAPWASASLRH